MLTVAILAGGRATRLGDLAARTPKALLEVAGRPFILRQLDLLRDQGVERVVLCLGHLAEQIVALVGDGSAAGLTVEYAYDGAVPLGTGGALKQALPMLGAEFFVMYGDSYLPCSLQQAQSAYQVSGRAALMLVLRNDNRWDTSNVRFHDGRLLAYDKRAPTADMRHIDAGISILSQAAFATSPQPRHFDLADLLHDLARRGALAGLEIAQRFYEIGSPDGLMETRQLFANGTPEP
ncbi:MAG TPA: nucleotidyltransferase family protein [Povalibacter sp.]|nr:nucleotidyltransferase family protein [Povalibacter sp.]